jgi:Ca2+-binding RTX toxin-like protein
MFRTGGADFQADAVIVNGTDGKESIRVAGEAFGASVLGLAAQGNSTWAKPGFDRPTVNALDGDDVVAASSLSADAIYFAGDSGAGNDTFTGGAGADVLRGRPGQNHLDGRPRDNILIWA